MTLPRQRRESSVNSFATGCGGVSWCVFRRSFSAQAVAAWCANYNENYDLDLDPVSPTSLLGRPCNAWLTTLWRLVSLRLLRPLLLNTCRKGWMRVVKWRRSIFSTTLRNVLASKGVDAPVPHILQALVDGIGDLVEQMMDVDVMAQQSVEDVVEHADEMECFLEHFLEKGVDEPVPQIREALD